MTPATLVITSLMALPPTWCHALTFSSAQEGLDKSNVPIIPSVLELASQSPTIIKLSSPAARYIAFESTEAARRISIERLQNKVAELKRDPLPDSDDREQSLVQMAAEIATKLIGEIPNNLPLPKAMLLSSQISFYWEFGETYAELSISGNGQLSMYGRQLGKGEILAETSFAKLRAAGLKFPIDLDKILIS